MTLMTSKDKAVDAKAKTKATFLEVNYWEIYPLRPVT